MSSVLLVNMPFSGADRPQIALGLLQSALRAKAIPCDVAYLNLVFADRLGGAFYEWFSGELPDMAFAGEWVFAHHFFGDLLLDGNGYLSYLSATGRADERTLNLILKVRALIPSFLEHCLDLVDWERYSIIGFTSTFQQNMAALSLAHEIKRLYPNKIIVFGGSNCGHPMGEAIQRCFPFVDYVFTGEADWTFPTFVERLNQHKPITDIKGIVYRNGTEVQTTGVEDPVTELDMLPFPNYDDFFQQLEATSLKEEVPLLVPFETARGCWWGAKQHCTFCGLNALSMNFRSKSKDRALEEILYLRERYGVRRLGAVDNIIDMKYFRELLPELKRRQIDLSIFYETKANLTKEQVKLLRDAGISSIQPGIESFNQRLLQLMRKGVSPLQNVQLLKWCRQYEIDPIWNLLYGIPGECATDYAEMLPLLECISHLHPPVSKGMIRLDRYSPYFKTPEAFGLVNARPARVYSYLYPFSEADLSDIAYHYEFSFADNLKPAQYIGPILRQLDVWSEVASRKGQLRAFYSDRELIIKDSRHVDSETSVRLSGWQSRVYEYCDQVRSLKGIESWFSQKHADVPIGELHSFLARLVKLKLMARDHDQYLSVAIIDSDTEEFNLASCA
jgi:ribosomal peptide maturation radical SAM protein 1